MHSHHFALFLSHLRNPQQVPDDTCGPSPDPANTDQAQLAEAAVEEYAKKKKPKKSRYELERYASKIVKMGGDGKEEFFQHLGRRMIEAGNIRLMHKPSTMETAWVRCYCICIVKHLASQPDLLLLQVSFCPRLLLSMTISMWRPMLWLDLQASPALAMLP